MSGESSGVEVELSAVHGSRGPAGVAHAAELLDFTEAVMGRDDARLAESRGKLRACLSPEAYVDTAAVIGAFNVVDRIADATGIPLDAPLFAMSESVRAELDLARFGSAANTPGAKSP